MKELRLPGYHEGMSYVAGLNTFDTQGNYNLRAFQWHYMLRNGFYSLGLEDIVKSTRVEGSGPNAAHLRLHVAGGHSQLHHEEGEVLELPGPHYWHGSLDLDKINLIDNSSSHLRRREGGEFHRHQFPERP